MGHTSVLRDEIISLLKYIPSATWCIDATLGEGGHTLALLRAQSSLRIIALDCDKEMISLAQLKLRDLDKRIHYAHCWFDEFFANTNRYFENNIPSPELILFDLGVSTPHYFDSGRGFSFAGDEQLDMRLDINNTLRADTIVNTATAHTLEDIFYRYGQERFAKQIAEAIVRARKRSPLHSTKDLVHVILRAFPKSYRFSRSIHPATRIFMALRIAVNNELQRLASALPLAFNRLKKGGLLAVISFHSGEDRLVKRFIQHIVGHGCGIAMTKKPVVASNHERITNRASRSAKLRVTQKLHDIIEAWNPSMAAVRV